MFPHETIAEQEEEFRNVNTSEFNIQNIVEVNDEEMNTVKISTENYTRIVQPTSKSVTKQLTKKKIGEINLGIMLF